MSATVDATPFDRPPVADRLSNELLAPLALWLAEVSAEAVRLALDTNAADDPGGEEP